MKGDADKLIRQILEVKEIGKRKRGRPGQTWIEEVGIAVEKIKEC